MEEPRTRLVTERTPRRYHPAVHVSISALILAFSAGACSDEEPANGVLDELAPTRADVAAQAGIEFPPSTTGFRLVRISGDQLDVTFQVVDEEVDDFAEGSGIELVDGERTIVHASPLWNVAVTAPLRGGTSDRDGVERSAEVVSEDGADTVRLTIRRIADSE